MLLVSVIVWLLCVTLLALFVRSHTNLHLSLGLAYLISLTFLHFLGALIYLDASYDPTADVYLRSKGTTSLQTIVGFGVATQFTVAYCVAYVSCVLAMFRKKSNFPFDLKPILHAPQVQKQLKKKLLGLFRLIFGLSLSFYGIYFILDFANIPSVSQLFAQGPVMLISSVMVAELLFPLGYELYFLIGLLCVLILFVQGFLSYSVSYIVIISGLLLSYKNIQKAYFLYGSVILFFAAVGLKAWLTSREVIRTLLFNGDSLSLDIVGQFLMQFYREFILSFQSDYASLFIAIDTRINLNNILGRVVLNWTPDIAIESINQLYVAFIPRLVWPGKPTLTGSADWVRQLADMSIAKDVSVGLGHIGELYGNFGGLGVWFGAIVIACIFATLDYKVNYHIYKMTFLDAWGFLMIGLSLIQPGGIFVKALNAAFITTVTFLLVRLLLKNLVSSKSTQGYIQL